MKPLTVTYDIWSLDISCCGAGTGGLRQGLRGLMAD